MDADERVTPELAAEIRDTLQADPREAGFRIPRVTWHLGRWIRTTDWYPDPQLRLYHRARATWPQKLVHESVAANGEVGRLRSELQHYAYRDLAITTPRWTATRTLAAQEMRERGRRAGVADLTLHPLAAFLRNYVLRRGCLDGVPGIHHFLHEHVLRVHEVREAVGARPRRHAAGRGLRRRAPTRVITSVHIDTARTWRGGQNQVLQLVTGLESLGHPTWLVAHARGELKRRAQEGLRFVGFAPRSEFDVQAAWQLGRVLRDVQPDVIHAHDPMGVALVAMAMQMSNGLARRPLVVAARRVDFH